MAQPRSWTIDDALDPRAEGPLSTWIVRVEQAHLDGLMRYGIAPKFYRLKLLPQSLASPVAIFEDLGREGQEEGLCYAARPSVDFRSESIEVPPPPEMVFLVFVTSDGKVFDWRWEKSDIENSDYPENYKNRFRRILWPAKQTL